MLKTNVVFILCLLFSPALVFANSYDVTVALDHGTRQLHATSVVTFRAPAVSSSVRFLLNKSLKVTSVDCASCKGFRFATTEPSPYRYMPGGAPLYVDLTRSVQKDEELTIAISYAGALAEIDWGTNLFTPDYAELAQYIGWYPFMPEMGKFRYTVAVNVDPAYSVTGEGVVKAEAPGRWRIVEDNETFDIAVVSSRGLKSKSLRNGDIKVFCVPGIDDAVPDQLIGDMDATMKALTAWFGPAPGGRLTLLLNQRAKGGSYVRPGFVSIPYTGGPYTAVRRRMIAVLGHELSHLWWNGASVVTWEDWLNESFAEYSSWLMVKHIFGTGEYEKQVAAVRERTKDKPPIWGIDRNSDLAYTVLYDKGALILHDLAARIGERNFLALATRSGHTSPRTTSGFLAALEIATSPQIRRDFETALKQ